MISENYVEIDLKIKDHQGQDKELSKGILSIKGIERRELERCELENGSLSTMLSTVDVMVLELSSFCNLPFLSM